MAREYKLAKSLKITLALFGLGIAAILGIMIAALVIGIETKNEMMDEFSKENLQAMLNDELALLDLEGMLSGAVTNPATINALIQAFSATLAQMRSVRSDEKRSPITCPNIPDPTTCEMTNSVCKQLHRCVSTYNASECFDFGYKALSLCANQNL